MAESQIYDYIIVGGGTTGAVLAARLAEDPTLRICVLEAGGAGDVGSAGDARELGNPSLLKTPLLKAVREIDQDFNFPIEHQKRGNSHIRQNCGSVLGGASTLSSAIAFRAPATDLEVWEEKGANGWGPAGTDSYYNRVFEMLSIESTEGKQEPGIAFVEAAQQAGFPLVRFNSEILQEGVGWFPLIKRGSLWGPGSSAYLQLLLRKGRKGITGLKIYPETFAYKIIFGPQNRAQGVETTRGKFFAEREVILCAGVFNSPKLLLLSGVGPAGHLHQLSIPVKEDLPGVGAHLMDRPQGVVIWEANKSFRAPDPRFWEAGLFVRTRESLERPDLLIQYGSFPFDLHTSPMGYLTARNGFSLAPTVMYPRSQGTVRLRSNDPKVPPLIDPAYYTDPEGYDEKVMIAGIRCARRLAAQSRMSSWIKNELAPGSILRTDAELSFYTRKTGNTTDHPAGTCMMGGDENPSAVVDSELRVYGTKGLRVADASIFPTLLGVDTSMTCMMIGEKAADLLNLHHRSSAESLQHRSAKSDPRDLRRLLC